MASRELTDEIVKFRNYKHLTMEIAEGETSLSRTNGGIGLSLTKKGELRFPVETDYELPSAVGVSMVSRQTRTVFIQTG